MHFTMMQLESVWWYLAVNSPVFFPSILGVFIANHLRIYFNRTKWVMPPLPMLSTSPDIFWCNKHCSVICLRWFFTDSKPWVSSPCFHHHLGNIFGYLPTTRSPYKQIPAFGTSIGKIWEDFYLSLYFAMPVSPFQFVSCWWRLWDGILNMGDTWGEAEGYTGFPLQKLPVCKNPDPFWWIDGLNHV